ncbi:MAG: hypothetical protein ABJF01_23095 [bacterium]
MFAAGVPRAVIDAVARRLGHDIVAEPNPDDEYGELLTVGPWRITIHDDCFVRCPSIDASIRESFLGAVVERHDYYLGTPIGPAGVALLQLHLRDGVELELSSDVKRREFRVKHYPVGAGWWARRRAPIERVLAGTTNITSLPMR